MDNNKLLARNVKVLQTIRAHNSDVTCVDFWGNLLFTGSSDKTVRVWRWHAGDGFVEESFSPLLGHRYGVTSVRISPQGSALASASVDGTIILWDISDGSKSNVLSQENSEAVRACAFSPDGTSIVTSDDSGTVCVWGQDKNIVRLLKCHEEAVHVVAFTPDSQVLLTACTLGNIRLNYINIKNDNLITINALDAACSIDAAHDLGVLSADFTKFVHNDPTDENIIIYTAATSGTDHFIKIWRIYCLRDIDAIEHKSRLVPTSPQEHLSGNSTIYCTQTMNAQCVITIPAHGSSVTCVRFNATGTLLISSSLDKSLKFWSLQGSCLKTMNEHTRYVNTIAVNNESSIIASGSNDRTVIIWDLTGKLSIESNVVEAKSLLFNLLSSSTDVPLDFICPITHEIMRSPVIAEDGFSYERSAIQEWFERGKNSSPMTNQELVNDELIENEELKEKINDYLKSMDFDRFDAAGPDLLN